MGALLGGLALGLLEGVTTPFMPVSWVSVVEFGLFVAALSRSSAACSISAERDAPLRLSAPEVALQPPPQAGPLKATIVRKPFFWLILIVTVLFAIAPLGSDDIALRERLDAGRDLRDSRDEPQHGDRLYALRGLGDITFFGLGGYIVVYLVSNAGWPLWIRCITAGVVVSALALLFGLGVLRLRGAFFGLATIGVNEGIRAFVSNFDPWGGASGLYVSMNAYAPLGGPGTALWVDPDFMVIATMGLALILSYAVKTSKFGLGLLAIGQNDVGRSARHTDVTL